MQGLILDTSTKQAIVGIADGQKLQTVTHIDGNRGLSSHLLPAIEPHVDNLCYIAVGAGPGSYMGTRTGATVAKTLAYAKGIPLIEFSSIFVSLPKDLAGPFIFVGDAKMQQWYLIEGLATEKGIQDLTSPQLVAKEELKSLKASDIKIIGLEPVEPHLYWASLFVQESLVQNRIIHPESLTLQYIR